MAIKLKKYLTLANSIKKREQERVIEAIEKQKQVIRVKELEIKTNPEAASNLMKVMDLEAERKSLLAMEKILICIGYDIKEED